MVTPPNFRQAIDNCIDCRHHIIKRSLSSFTKKQRIFHYCTKYDYEVSDITICDDYNKMVNIVVRKHREED